MTPEEQKTRRRNLAIGWAAFIGTFTVGACCGSVGTFGTFIAPLLAR